MLVVFFFAREAWSVGCLVGEVVGGVVGGLGRWFVDWLELELEISVNAVGFFWG